MLAGMDPRKKILVTGGFGFIGAAMVRRLLQEGYQVGVLVKAGTKSIRLADVISRVEIIEDNLLDATSIAQKVQAYKPDGVFHFAASNIQSGVTAGNQDVVNTNILGTVNLIDALAPLPYDFCIHIGTFLEYGMKGRPIKEDDMPEPPNLYSISKLAATLYGQAVGKKEGKPIVTLRLMTPYGPGMQEKRLVREVIERALKNEAIALTAPSVSRDFIYVDDFIDLCLEAAASARAHAGELFNAGTGVATTLETLSKEVLEVTRSSSAVAWGSFKEVAYDSDLWCADMTKTFSAFSWRPKTPRIEGITATKEWIESGATS
jgi:dolichol-phosphate mannosyltransferase